jgi:hypothetical protein
MQYTLAISLLIALCSAANSAPITFRFEGTGSGTIGSTPFANTPFVITAQGDTSNRSTTGLTNTDFSTPHDSAQIFLQSVGSFAFVSPTRTFVNIGKGVVGFSRNGPSFKDLYNGPTHSNFSSWSMLQSIGPINGSSALLQWDETPLVFTNGGIIIFQNADVVANAVFTATLVPEPSVACITILSGLFFTRRRKSVPHNRV